MIFGALLLLITAAALIAAELFLPSHGIMAILAAGCALASVIMAFQVSPMLGVAFGVGLAVLSPVVLYWAVKLYPKSPMGKRVMLDAPHPSGADAANVGSSRLQDLVGQRGVAMTMLRPSGAVDLNGERVNCVSESEIIYPDTPVEVIRVTGMKIVVKPVSTEES